MELNTKQKIKKKILDIQEIIKDYKNLSKEVDDMEAADLFREYAEQCGLQAAELQKLLKKF